MISIGAFYKVQYPFIIKALDKTGVEGKVPQPNKVYMQNPPLISYVMVIASNIRNNTRTPISPLLINKVLAVLSRAFRQERD